MGKNGKESISKGLNGWGSYSPYGYPPVTGTCYNHNGHGYYPPAPSYPPAAYPPSYYPPTSYPPSHQGHGSRVGAALATAAAAYGVHRIAHGSHYGGHGYGAYAGHMPGAHYGKFKLGKFGKHKHGMFGGKFKKWK
ncbi:uncharacterized protein LOC141811907 [Curcuma longa]|uniref:uncharacterized protein LOC141811907 n=1 Tax=Curcuma longa TaxID=136217 RepID=UPI003D9F9926